MNGFGAFSEIGKLRKVLVCRPGLAHERLAPANAAELLYDDVLWVQEARVDHADFQMKMQDHGVEVLDFHDQLEKTVTTEQARNWILDRRITENHVGVGMLKELRSWLDEMPPGELARFLIGGVAVHECGDTRAM